MLLSLHCTVSSLLILLKVIIPLFISLPLLYFKTKSNRQSAWHDLYSGNTYVNTGLVIV